MRYIFLAIGILLYTNSYSQTLHASTNKDTLSVLVQVPYRDSLGNLSIQMEEAHWNRSLANDSSAVPKIALDSLDLRISDLKIDGQGRIIKLDNSATLTFKNHDDNSSLIIDGDVGGAYSAIPAIRSSYYGMFAQWLALGEIQVGDDVPINLSKAGVFHLIPNDDKIFEFDNGYCPQQGQIIILENISSDTLTVFTSNCTSIDGHYSVHLESHECIMIYCSYVEEEFITLFRWNPETPTTKRKTISTWDSGDDGGTQKITDIVNLSATYGSHYYYVRTPYYTKPGMQVTYRNDSTYSVTLDFQDWETKYINGTNVYSLPAHEAVTIHTGEDLNFYTDANYKIAVTPNWPSNPQNISTSQDSLVMNTGKYYVKILPNVEPNGSNVWTSSSGGLTFAMQPDRAVDEFCNFALSSKSKKMYFTNTSGSETFAANNNGVDLQGRSSGTLKTRFTLNDAISIFEDARSTKVGIVYNGRYESDFCDSSLVTKRYVANNTDPSSTNEGSLTVGAGISTTSVINSNTSGSTGVTLSASTGLSIAESGNTITLTNTDADQSTSNEGSLSVTAGSGSTSVIHSNTSGATDVTLNAGTGMSISENTGTGNITLTNSSPDQTVAFTNGTGISVTGTYPNFTVTNSDADQSTTNEGSLTVGAGTSTTSLINSNTSGSTAVTLTAAGGVTLSESGNNITISSASSPDGSAGQLQFKSNTSNNIRGIAAFVADSATEKITITGNSSTTNAVVNKLVLDNNSTGTPAAGLGNAIEFQGETSTTTDQSMGNITGYWSDATHATRTGKLGFGLVRSGGALTEVLTISKASGLTDITAVDDLELFGGSNKGFRISSTTSSRTMFGTTTGTPPSLISFGSSTGQTDGLHSAAALGISGLVSASNSNAIVVKNSSAGSGGAFGTASTVKEQNCLSAFNGGASPVFFMARADRKVIIGDTSTVSTDNALTVIGNIQLRSIGNKLMVKEGSNASMGVATLVAGTVTVSNTLVTANTRIFVTIQTASGTLGSVYISARTAGTSFAITSTSALDTSTVAWFFVEPAP